MQLVASPNYPNHKKLNTNVCTHLEQKLILSRFNVILDIAERHQGALLDWDLVTMEFFLEYTELVVMFQKPGCGVYDAHSVLRDLKCAKKIPPHAHHYTTMLLYCLCQILTQPSACHCLLVRPNIFLVSYYSGGEPEQIFLLVSASRWGPLWGLLLL